jgi:predicted methyltransferase/DNA-directed RNA polymerase subunit RPC12/RpoP
VAAVNNELRERGVVTRERPSRLTPYGRSLLGGVPGAVSLDPTCPECDGHGVTIPPVLGPLIERLNEVMAAAPAVDLTLDQSYSTAETKLRRVLLLLRAGLLPAPGVLLIGDDDLMSVAVAMVGQALGRPLVGQLAVVDISRPQLDLIADQLSTLDTTADVVEHDLRRPLPSTLEGRFELAMTDPPYTVEGARLFLSRAVEGLRPGAGHSIAFSFGPKGPTDTLRVQQAVTELGLTIQAMYRGFNHYHGAGVLGGQSHLQVLGTSERTRPVVEGAYAGPLYTAENRAADRLYLCLECGRQHPVGPSSPWPTIAALKEAGCPDCGGRRLRPMHLNRPPRESQPRATNQPAPRNQESTDARR